MAETATPQQSVPADTYTPEQQEALESAYGRSSDLDWVSEFLRCASLDPVWRGTVEAALSQKRIIGGALTGGSKASDVWRKSLLRDRVERLLRGDAKAFQDFVFTNPRVLELQDAEGDRDGEILAGYEPVDRTLIAHAYFMDQPELVTESIHVFCDHLEATASSIPDPVEQPQAVPSPAAAADSRLHELQQTIKDLQATVESQKKQIKTLGADLRKRQAEESRKDRLVGKHSEAAKAAEKRAQAAEADARKQRLDHDEAKREVKRLTSLVRESKSGKRTVEDKAAAESERLQADLTTQRERLRAAQQMQQALESRVTTLERDLEQERARRTTLEEAFQVFGMDDLAGSARSLQSTLEQLNRLQQGIVAYTHTRAQQEHERRQIEEAAEIQRTAAETARNKQAEVERAWAEQEKERLKEHEDTLFPDGPLGHIIIDGHNLILRAHRPDAEKSTREWLEKMVGRMAQRLEARGWDTRIHLAFDTPHASNQFNAAHGVTVYFCNNTYEGGADAKIRAILEEGNPFARYMVVSTDRKHVWADAIEWMKGEQADVDIVQVELLARYLETLDEVGA